jgi:hypothetical protein
MEKKGKSVLRPFHESIVNVMKNINSNHPYLSDAQMLRALAVIIKSTEIRKGHEEIITAWQAYAKRCWVDDETVIDSVVAQKQT